MIAKLGAESTLKEYLAIRYNFYLSLRNYSYFSQNLCIQ